MKFEIELWKGGREGWAGRSYAPLRFAFHSLVFDSALGRLLCCQLPRPRWLLANSGLSRELYRRMEPALSPTCSSCSHCVRSSRLVGDGPRARLSPLAITPTNAAASWSRHTNPAPADDHQGAGCPIHTRLHRPTPPWLPNSKSMADNLTATPSKGEGGKTKGGGKKKGKGKKADAPPETHRCFHCQTEGTEMMRCTQCKRAWYCGRPCQKKHWKQHKRACVAAVAAEARRATLRREATATRAAAGGSEVDNETCVICVGPLCRGARVNQGSAGQRSAAAAAPIALVVRVGLLGRAYPHAPWPRPRAPGSVVAVGRDMSVCNTYMCAGRYTRAQRVFN